MRSLRQRHETHAHGPLPTSTLLPVGVNSPVVGLMRNEITLVAALLATSMYLPVGSMAKLRGVLMPCASWPTAVNSPVFGSIEKIAIELYGSRLET